MRRAQVDHGDELDPQHSRGVAQPGSALAWGARGRGFKSRRPDQSGKWSDIV